MFATAIGGTLLEPLFPCELNENADGVRTLFWSPDIVYSPPDGTGKLIYTDQPQAWLKYIARVTDVNMFDAIFMEALSWRLAAAINMPLTGSADLGNNALTMYRSVILSAGSHSQNESQEPQPPVDEFTAARLS